MNYSDSKEIASLLEYPNKTDESPSQRFIFVYARGAEPYADDDVLMEDALKRDFIIDGFKFSKGEYQWWFIFDCEKKKIIIKGSKLVLLNDVIWQEDHNYFIFNFGSSPGTNLEFWNIKNVNKPSFVLEAYYVNKKSILFSNDSMYIAYQYIYKRDEFSGVSTDEGIKIRNIEKQKDIAIINPETKYGELKIVKWESDKKLTYREINKKQGIDKEMSFTIK